MRQANNSGGTWTSASDAVSLLVEKLGVAKTKVYNRYYTPTAIILAQAVIATPIVAGISLASIQKIPEALRLQILALGATRIQMVWMLIKEARLPLLAAVMAGFAFCCTWWWS